VDCVRPNIEGYSHVDNIPVSLRPLRNAATKRAEASGELPAMNPTTGIGCCARAVSGHAAAAPPRSV
jgi:hypothetical protein